MADTRSSTSAKEMLTGPALKTTSTSAVLGAVGEYDYCFDSITVNLDREEEEVVVAVAAVVVVVVIVRGGIGSRRRRKRRKEENSEEKRRERKK